MNSVYTLLLMCWSIKRNWLTRTRQNTLKLVRIQTATGECSLPLIWQYWKWRPPIVDGWTTASIWMTSLTTWHTRKTTTIPTSNLVDLSPAALWAFNDALPAEGTMSLTAVEPSARRTNVEWWETERDCSGTERCASTLSDAVPLDWQRFELRHWSTDDEDDLAKICFLSTKVEHDDTDAMRTRVDGVVVAFADVVIVVVVVQAVNVFWSKKNPELNDEFKEERK